MEEKSIEMFKHIAKRMKRYHGIGYNESETFKKEMEDYIHSNLLELDLLGVKSLDKEGKYE